MYSAFFKHFFDFCIAFIALLFLLPIIIVATILLWFANDKKPFFFQERPGKSGKLFKIIKFKTMNDKKDASGNLLPDSDRLTAIGAIIRKTSLDELPQLFNVLKGDMSLVGPRPLLPEYLDIYTPEEHKRHLVRPGITGWAQVNGRNAISWKQKFEFDVWYVTNYSLRVDVAILVKTVYKVIKRSDINSSSEVPMERYTGHN